MGIELEIVPKEKIVRTTHPQSVSSLVSGFWGTMKKGEVRLEPEEALYLIDIRNAKVHDAAQNAWSFNEVAQCLQRQKLMARYLAFKDWRDRGLIARPIGDFAGPYSRSPIKKYPEGKYEPPGFEISACFYPDDLMSVIDDDSTAKALYENYWFGQWATYKAEQRGRLGKLDIYETMFLLKHASLKLSNSSEKEVMKVALKRRPDFRSLFEVYEDWRLQGFVLKTGFKFGTHFRIYFPGAKPGAGEKWMHSQHVLHVFPRSSKLLISEWARAIRVAHSVRKTFILAIPGQRKKKKDEKKSHSLALHSIQSSLDFLLYHRKGNDIENPKNGQPRYLMLSFYEEEMLAGEQLAMAIDACKSAGLELIVAIADRETSITYYVVHRIELPASEYEYYEIEWVQP
jgi:tRNA-intron endonuclease